MRGYPALELESFLEAERHRVGQALDRALRRISPLLDPSLRGAVEQGVRAGGKRLRPIFCVTAYRASGGREESDSDRREAPYDLAASLELIHAYSLMHDDLPCMDYAALRRGEPTTHTIHGERATVLAGAALIPAAALQLWIASGALGLNEGTRRELVRILSRAAGAAGMVGGQALDLLGEGERQLSRDEMDALHGRKTGALLSASLLLGSTAAGASRRTGEALQRYGEEVGLAFQIADDVLDATADAGTLGKHPSDWNLGKSTYVALLGIDGARQEAGLRVEQALAALAEGGIESPPLEALARYVVHRDR
ncbi:MAG: polyprenyl synthetase family protein [Gemmatimonadetes bacterium]|nr:polyprenyl synthetase family protein [Gemmatimonadota bacterium]